MIDRTEQEIICNWKGDSTIPLVSICTITYNHEKFIAEALDSFLMQETNFPFEIVVDEDCSTDRTADVIRRYIDKYPNIVNANLREKNVGIHINSVGNFKRTKGKYIAHCEGDDYWIDPLKLQKQVDFLEENSEYIMCWTRFDTLEQKTGKLELDKNGNYFLTKKGIDFTFEVFAKGWHIGMQTLVYRRKHIMENNNSNNKFYRDIFLISDLLSIGKGFCLNDATAVYRIHDTGIYSSTNELERAEAGATIYKEIYRIYSNNEFLKIKFKNFNAHYINCLIKNNLHKEALFILNDRAKLLIALDTHKYIYFYSKKEKLFQLKLYLHIKLKQLIMSLSEL